MNIFYVVGFSVLACTASVIVKKFGETSAFLIPAVCAICLGAAAVAAMSPLGDFVRDIDPAGEYSSYFSVMMKGLGTAMLGECAADICNDCGETSIARGAEICTKICILVIALPLLKSLVELSREILA